MQRREGLGIGVAGIVIGTGVALVDWRPPLGLSIVGLGAVILVLTFAPSIPGLRAIPLVGAVQPLTAIFALDGTDRMIKELIIRQGGLQRTSGRLEVGIRNSARNDIRGATVQLLASVEMRLHELDDTGWPTKAPTGRFMPPTSESLLNDEHGSPSMSDYWTRRLDLPGRTSTLLPLFGLSFSRPTIYRLRLKIVAADLHQPLVEDVEICAVVP